MGHLVLPFVGSAPARPGAGTRHILGSHKGSPYGCRSEKRASTSVIEHLAIGLLPTSGAQP